MTTTKAETESYESLLIAKPKKKAGSHLVTFLMVAILAHALFFIWISKYGTNFIHKKSLVFNISMVKPPPPPKPKPPKPPPKPKVTPPKPQPKKPQAAAPKLKMTQVHFHMEHTKTSSGPSNLLQVGESKGGSTYGNPEGIQGGKGPMTSTGTAKQGAPTPPPPPPPPKPAIPDRKDPVVTGRCTPQYPVDEMNNGVQGTVQILVEIGPDGKILSVSVGQSSGNSDLDNAAVEAVRSCWQFAPAIQGGKGVTAHLSFPVTFELQQ